MHGDGVFGVLNSYKRLLHRKNTIVIEQPLRPLARVFSLFKYARLWTPRIQLKSAGFRQLGRLTAKGLLQQTWAFLYTVILCICT